MRYEDIGRHAYRILAATTLAVLVIGTIFYHMVEHFKWLDAYYFSVVTLATVGYGDLTPHTDAGKLFTTFYIFVGVGIVAAFISYTLRRRAAISADRRKRRQERKQ